MMSAFADGSGTGECRELRGDCRWCAQAGSGQWQPRTMPIVAQARARLELPFVTTGGAVRESVAKADFAPRTVSPSPVRGGQSRVPTGVVRERGPGGGGPRGTRRSGSRPWQSSAYRPDGLRPRTATEVSPSPVRGGQSRVPTGGVRERGPGGEGPTGTGRSGRCSRCRSAPMTDRLRPSACPRRSGRRCLSRAPEREEAARDGPPLRHVFRTPPDPPHRERLRKRGCRPACT